MKTLMSFTSNSRAYAKWLESGRPASKPSDVPFGLPDETRNKENYK
jgi:hypothetical protein